MIDRIWVGRGRSFFAVRFISALMVAASLLTPGSLRAEEVSLDYKGNTLLGTLTMAEGKKMSDGVLLVLHGTLAHKDMEIITALRDLMAERGFSTLTPSLSLGLSNRRGMYDCAVTHTHRHMDAVDEVAVWVNWLKKKRAGSIWVAGHSRGAKQIVQYALGTPDAAVKKVISIAPSVSGRKKLVAGFKRTHKADLSSVLTRAEKLIAEGKGDMVMKGVGILYCPGADVTASSFVGYYGKDLRLNTAKMASGLNLPTLFVGGSEDTVNPGVAAAVKSMVDNKKISVVEVEGAGHFFRDLFGEDVADAISEFIGG